MRFVVWGAAASLLAQVAHAQVGVQPITPGQIEQLAPSSLPQLSPGLRPSVPEAQRGPGAQQRVPVGAVRVTGNTSLPSSALLPFLEPLVGEATALAAIEDARIQVISAYGRAGYPFVSAAASLSQDGGRTVLTVTVTEGEIASVKLDGDIGPAGTQVLRFLQTMVGGPITALRLERGLLLAGDVPGVTVRGVVRPYAGGAPGQLELVAQVQRRAFTGYLAVDNRGYRLTGPVQGLLNVGANSFSSLGERIEATLFLAQDNEQIFGQVSAEAFLGASGLRGRVYAGRGRSTPGGVLEDLNYEGTSTLWGAALQYPVLRSRAANLFAIAGFESLDSEVEVGSPAFRQSLDRVRAVRVGFEGNALDTYVPFTPAPAITTASVRLHRGTGWFGATSNRQADPPSRVDSDFEFTKWTAEISRSQPILAPTDNTLLRLFGLVSGQRSGDVLPTSEKFLLGGQRLGRGFYAGQVTGDTAIGVSVEIQLDYRPGTFSLPLPSRAVEVSPVVQFYAFRDYGRTWENLQSDLDRTIESWGGGARFMISESLQFDVEAVRRLTRSPDGASANLRPLPETAGFFRLLTRF